MSRYPYKEGTRVKALKNITESGKTPGCKDAIFLEEDYIHALKGEMGTVEGVDDNTPTVRFDKTGTATIVGPDEIVEVKSIHTLMSGE